jgi:hypothetical protein
LKNGKAVLAKEFVVRDADGNYSLMEVSQSGRVIQPQIAVMAVLHRPLECEVHASDPEEVAVALKNANVGVGSYRLCGSSTGVFITAPTQATKHRRKA